MKKYYASPEYDIRQYKLVKCDVITASTPEEESSNNLNNDDTYDIFGK